MVIKKFIGWLIFCIWLLLASGGFARWWLAHPDVINYPQSFWDWAVDIYQPKCCEESADLEDIVALLTGLMLALVMSAIVFITWRLSGKLKLKSRPSTPPPPP